ncbi:MAG TPA: hypothetical protein DDW49_09165 [Deltaproteobacteria bacterium]|nr:MAG: hypothetical protein A2048_00180 [Deltaproteobacteria bacterium GWA2_45_12]HBF13530.1 hypothetical protein [Deltaproteobacteria bacterium]
MAGLALRTNFLPRGYRANEEPRGLPRGSSFRRKNIKSLPMILYLLMMISVPNGPNTLCN